MGAYDDLLDRSRQIHLLGKSAAVLGWDQETMMPAGGVRFRSQQLALLASLVHERATDPAVGELLAACEADESVTGDPTSVPAANVRELRRGYGRATKLPSDLVREMAETSSLARHAWAEARKESDFAKFRPWLEKHVALSRRQAECYGWPDGGEPWDALAEGYEPGCTAAQIEAVFAPLRARLAALIGELRGGPKQPSRAFLELRLPQEKQERFVRFVADSFGFDWQRGRLDVSAHPFTSGTHRGDVRMTTRFGPDNVLDALGSTMHETGHALYEQGLPAEHVGAPVGEAVSLGIHESQSRLWENQVGRSREFWTWCFPRLREFFGSAADAFTLDGVYGAANLVEPSFIRVEADEATYNLHIMVRFEIERALIRGDLEAAGVPAAWNEKYRDYLGLDVPDDARGCLQDIHWSMGSFGYFPTYTLGNLYAAQLFEKAQEDLGDLAAQIERGDFGGLRIWLNENVHAHGSRYLPGELCERVTGKSLSADPLLRHLETKLKPLYGIG